MSSSEESQWEMKTKMECMVRIRFAVFHFHIVKTWQSEVSLTAGNMSP